MFGEFEAGGHTGLFSPVTIQGQRCFIGKRIDEFGFEFECQSNANIANMSEILDQLTSLTCQLCLDSDL